MTPALEVERYGFIFGNLQMRHTARCIYKVIIWKGMFPGGVNALKGRDKTTSGLLVFQALEEQSCWGRH